MLTGLQAILEKQVVLSTVNAHDLQTRPQKIEGEYLKHVETFIPMGDIEAFGDRLADQVVKGKTPKGMIVAPYGYGKTSTVAFLWSKCEQRGLIAVPPFICADFTDILGATYGWVRYRLQQREPGLVDTLDKLHHRYTEATLEEMAKRYAAEHGLAKIGAIQLLQSAQHEGHLVLDLKPVNLMAFLDETTELVSQAGFAGLVIMPDEFQQYFSKSTQLRLATQEFRDFVWALDTRDSHLGVVFSMPTHTEGVIQEQGKDILHRLKKHNLYYRLQDIYSADFPARLWQRYTYAFQIGPKAAEVIDQETLIAVGQIAEREDLGEGPRTVIDSLKRAILGYQTHGRAYTPIDLVDDFLATNINFQAQANKLKTVTRQALESAIVDSADKRSAIKLMAAFPRGCPVEVQKKYGVYGAVNALSKAAHGELMTHLIEGYTLLGLSRTGGPTHTVDIIVTQFWQGYEEDELHLEAAVRAFTSHLLPRFFEPRRGTAATGWGKLDFQPTPTGSYAALIDGTFNAPFPRRRVILQVAHSEIQCQPFNPTVDLQLDFLLHSAALDEPGAIAFLGDRHIRFGLNVAQHLRPPLPDDLSKLQQLVNPEFVTPLLMLSLVDYFGRWEMIAERQISQNDRSEIDSYFIPRLLDHVVQLLFNQRLAETVSPPLRRLGRFMVEELFNKLCVQLYPKYQTFFVQGQHDKLYNDYINAMQGMSLKERRGHAELRGAKANLATRFGLTSTATFENRIASDYSNLMKAVQFSGRNDDSVAVLRLKLHPLEEDILEQVRHGLPRQIDGRAAPAADANTIAAHARSLGYRDEETLLALQLLTARGYTRLDQASKSIYLAQIGPEAGELAGELVRLTSKLNQAQSLLSGDRVRELQGVLATLQARLDAAAEDEEELNEVETLAHDLDMTLAGQLQRAKDAAWNKIGGLMDDINRAHLGLRQSSALDREIQGQVAFVMHLNELRIGLAARRKKLQGELGALKSFLSAARDGVSGGPANEVLELAAAAADGDKKLETLRRTREELDQQVVDLERWIKLLKDADLLFNNLARLPDLRDQLTGELIPEVQAHLAKRKLDALGDWEPFQNKLSSVAEELENRRRHGNEAYGQVKEQYEQFLRDIDVRDYRPVSRYTYGEDEGSYDDLRAEVHRKINGRLDEIAADLAREQSDLLQAKFVNLSTTESPAIVQKVERDLSEANHTLRQLRQALTLDLIRSIDTELTTFGERVRELAVVAQNARQDLGTVLHAAHDLTETERQTYEALRNQQEVDLTDLFVRLYQQDQSLTVRSLLATLESLYRKRRLIIRLRPRG